MKLYNIKGEECKIDDAVAFSFTNNVLHTEGIWDGNKKIFTPVCPIPKEMCAFAVDQFGNLWRFDKKQWINI